MAKRASLSSGLSGLAKQKPSAAENIPAPAEVMGTTRATERPAKQGMRGYNVRMSAESLGVLKRAALDNETTMRAIFVEGVNDWLTRNGIAHTVE